MSELPVVSVSLSARLLGLAAIDRALRLRDARPCSLQRFRSTEHKSAFVTKAVRQLVERLCPTTIVLEERELAERDERLCAVGRAVQDTLVGYSLRQMSFAAACIALTGRRDIARTAVHLADRYDVLARQLDLTTPATPFRGRYREVRPLLVALALAEVVAHEHLTAHG